MCFCGGKFCIVILIRRGVEEKTGIEVCVVKITFAARTFLTLLQIILIRHIITSSLSSLFLYMSSYPVIWFSCPFWAGAIHDSRILVSDLASPLKSVGWEGTAAHSVKRWIHYFLHLCMIHYHYSHTMAMMPWSHDNLHLFFFLVFSEFFSFSWCWIQSFRRSKQRQLSFLFLFKFLMQNYFSLSKKKPIEVFVDSRKICVFTALAKNWNPLMRTGDLKMQLQKCWWQCGEWTFVKLSSVMESSCGGKKTHLLSWLWFEGLEKEAHPQLTCRPEP